MALSLFASSEYRKGKVMHRVPRSDLVHTWRKHLLGTCPIHYVICATSELNPETLFHVEKTPVR